MRRVLGSALALLPLLAAEHCSALAAPRRGGGSMQEGLQKLWHWPLKCQPSRRPKALCPYVLPALQGRLTRHRTHCASTLPAGMPGKGSRLALAGLAALAAALAAGWRALAKPSSMLAALTEASTDCRNRNHFLMLESAITF